MEGQKVQNLLRPALGVGPDSPCLSFRPGKAPGLACRVGTGESGIVLSEEGNSACLARCSGGLRPLVELCANSCYLNWV